MIIIQCLLIVLQISNISNVDHISYHVRSYFILQFHNVTGYFNIGIWVTHLDKCFKVLKNRSAGTDYVINVNL